MQIARADFALKGSPLTVWCTSQTVLVIHSAAFAATHSGSSKLTRAEPW